MFADHFVITCPKDKGTYKKIYDAMLQHVGGNNEMVIRARKQGVKYREMYVYSVVKTAVENEETRLEVFELLKEFGIDIKSVVRPLKHQTRFAKISSSLEVAPQASSSVAAAAIPAIEVVEVKAEAEPEKCKHGCPVDECSWCTDLGH